MKHPVEGKIGGGIELTGRRGRRYKPLLGDIKDTRRCCKLKEEALDRALWITCLGSGYGPVVIRHTT